MSRFASPAKGYLQMESWHTTKLSLLWVALHLQRCKKTVVEVGGFNCCAFGTIKSRDCARIK